MCVFFWVIPRRLNFICRRFGTLVVVVVVVGGGSSTVSRGRANRPYHDQQHCYHHAPTVKPETATAVVELLVMSFRTPQNMLSCT
jgi:hypothetical protein